jgi:radical SAM superfamily enzyme YgiQ (UPF0313 family)
MWDMESILDRKDKLSVKKAKLLLSSPIKPFGPEFGDGFSCQTSGSHQLTWAQDIFRVEDQMWHWGLDVIAANITTPTTVLHYPTLDRFRHELKNDYDYVGISFNLSTLHKIKDMVKVVRELSPKSKVILGGYGAVLSNEQLDGLADYICREEGVAFMRRILGDKEKPFINPDFIIERYIFSLKLSRIGILFNAVGCPNGCDFCCTSHFYKRKKVYFNTNPKKLLEQILMLNDKKPPLESVIIFDDDFLVDESRARQFLEEARSTDKVIDIMIFASVRSISRFSAREIAQMGVTKIWIGFEGLEAGYEKQQGKSFKDAVEELRQYGIAVTASMMIGFDYQNEKIIFREFSELTSCNPSSTQIILITPCIGTPLWDKLEMSSRIRQETKEDYRFHDGFRLLFKHPIIPPEKLEQIQNELYRREYGILGPSLFRILYTYFLGYKNLRNDSDPTLRKRAAYFEHKLRKAYVLYKIGIYFAPNNQVREQLKVEYRCICECLGQPTFFATLLTVILLPFIFWTKLRFHYDIKSQPRSMRREYNTE